MYKILERIVKNLQIYSPLVFFCWSIICLVLTYSRYAWLGLFTIFAFCLVYFLIYYFLNLKRKLKIFKVDLKNILRTWRVLSFIILALPILIGIIAINLTEEQLQLWPKWLAKPSSTFWHAMRNQATLELLKQNPKEFIIGFGLGASGPAAKTEYYPIQKFKIFRENEQIAYQYRLVGEDLTIPENWYLQTVINGGIVYALIYLYLVLQPVLSLYKWLLQNSKLSKLNLQQVIELSMFNILLGNLFLHIWEAQIIALYWTILFLFTNGKLSKENSS